MPSLVMNEVVEASIRRLKAMGLDITVMPEGENEVFIFIRMESLIDIIRKQVTYQNKKVALEGNVIVIDLWRR